MSALVTGGAHGLGAATCRALHGAGHRVAVADVDGATAQALAAELDASGKTAIGVELDVREERAFEAALASLEGWAPAEVLVNNAAVTRARPTMEIPVEEFDEVLAVNVRGTFLGSRIFGRAFRERGYGRIINLASLAGQNGGTATGAHYAASKGAILTLTKVFARDLAPFGVTVNAVAPGPLDLPSVRRIVPPHRFQELAAGVPVGRLGDAGFVAGMVALLASREASFVTGATWDANGGLYMR